MQYFLQKQSFVSRNCEFFVESRTVPPKMDTTIEVKDVVDDTWIEVSKSKIKVDKSETPLNKSKTNSNKKNQNSYKTQPNSNTSLKSTVKSDTKKTVNRKRSESEQSKTSETASIGTIVYDNETSENHPDCVTSLGLSLNQLSIAEQQQKQHGIKPIEFCEICRKFDINSSEMMAFHVRGLVNTGCACFRNCIIQALLSLKPFVSLVSTLLRTVADPNLVPTPQFAVWRELLTLMEEFATASSDRMVVVSSSKKTMFNLGKKAVGSIAGRAECITANLYMSGLFQAFQRNIDAIRPPPKFNFRSNKPALNKTTQEDAMEFLTFLLDALHEEIATWEKSERAASRQSTETSDAQEAAGESPVIVESSGVSDCGSSGETVDLEVSRLPEDEDEDEEVRPPESEGWNTVTKSRVKNVIDAPSREAVRVAGEASVINKIFHGTLRSEVNYKIKKINSVTFQRFFTLTLDMGSTAAANALLRKSRFTLGGSGVSNASKSEPQMTVEECLDTYFQEEVLVESEVKKQLRLEVLPPVLVLQLSRFSYDYNKMIPVKIMQEVTYPVQLVLPERYMAEELVDQLHDRKRGDQTGKAVYELSSVVLHHGEKTQNGHYSTYAREVRANAAAVVNGAEEPTASVWRAFNDTKVSVISEQQVLSANSLAYILFYTKK